MKRSIYTILMIASVACSCDSGLEPENNSSDSAIYLTAAAENHAVTKTPYEYETPNDKEDGALHVEIWASSFKENDIYNYPDSDLNGKNGTGENENQVAIHATADFNSSAPQLLNDAVYPRDGKPVSFIGFHPYLTGSEGWQLSGTDAVFTFDGSQDAMFAPHVIGSYASSGQQVTDAPNLTFWHLLTLLKIRMHAEDAETVAAWGAVKKMEITSRNQIKVNLGRSDDKNNNALNTDIIEYSNDVLLPLHAHGTDNIFPAGSGYTLQTSPKETAYVLCAPVEAIVKEYDAALGQDVNVPEYNLHIETVYRKLVLPIDLKYNTTTYYETATPGSLRAKSFTLNLIFKKGNTVVVNAEVDDWDFGGSGDLEL